MPPLPPPRTLDPDGYYASLGLEPGAPQSQIPAAFRARARVLHPDVPRTGNAEAFVRLKRAYDVLSHPHQRAAYDRKAAEARVGAAKAAAEASAAGAARKAAGPKATDPGGAGAGAGPRPFGGRPAGASAASGKAGGAADEAAADDVLEPKPGLTLRELRLPRMQGLSGVPVAIWVAIGAVLGFGTLETVAHLSSPPKKAEANIRPNAPSVAPLSPSAHRAVLYGPSPVRLAGTPNFYITPGPGPAALWQWDPAGKAMRRVADLPNFSSVQALGLERQTGMVEVRVTDRTTGFIAADRTAPGDIRAARRAYCGYNAGSAPEDGELLQKRASGQGTVVLDNNAPQPAVVKLRDAAGAVALSVFLAPGSHAEVGDVPNGTYHPEFAFGELWSRACNGFTAEAEMGRLKQPVTVPGQNRIVLTPDSDGTSWSEISEQAFERD
ncbi:MAG TPA: J domain-containing protein [Rhodopila sp.]|nr:J domain-containing protein [Rhodopila sp.]